MRFLFLPSCNLGPCLHTADKDVGGRGEGSTGLEARGLEESKARNLGICRGGAVEEARLALSVVPIQSFWPKPNAF